MLRNYTKYMVETIEAKLNRKIEQNDEAINTKVDEIVAKHLVMEGIIGEEEKEKTLISFATKRFSEIKKSFH